MENLKSLEGKAVRVFEATYNHSSFAAPICMTGKCTLVDVENGWITLDDDKVFNLKFLNRIEIVKESGKKKKKAEEKEAKEAEKRVKKELNVLKRAEKKAKRDAKKAALVAKKLAQAAKRKSTAKSKKNDVEMIIDKPEDESKLDLEEKKEIEEKEDLDDDEILEKEEKDEEEHDEFYIDEDEE